MADPGSSIGAQHRRFFDPAAYRLVLFDQRGCGQSRPAGETRNNTTWDLVDDIERLRLKLGVTRWMLFGGSWGSTLAIAYAQTHPERVSGLVLRGVFLGTDDEVSWFLTGLQRFLPEAWSRFSAGRPHRPCHRPHCWSAYACNCTIWCAVAFLPLIS
jgi:proline iminopeptidase